MFNIAPASEQDGLCFLFFLLWIGKGGNCCNSVGCSLSVIMLRKPAVLNETVGSSASKCHFQELQPTALYELSRKCICQMPLCANVCTIGVPKGLVFWASWCILGAED